MSLTHLFVRGLRLAIGLSVLCAANPVKATTFVRTIHGDDTTFHLPRDMCDATGSFFGESLLKTLNTTAERNKLAPIPILVFAECTSLNSKERELTPRTWGYFGYSRSPKQNPTEFNQHIFNKYRQSSHGKGIFNAAVKLGADKTDQTLQEVGQTLSLGHTVQIQPDLVDEYGYITRMVIAVAVSGKKSTLMIGAMAKVLKGKIILQYLATRMDDNALNPIRLRDDMHVVASKMHNQ